MYKKTVNFFRGSVLLRVSGVFPERFLNLCAQNGVLFWEVSWLDEHTLTLRVSRASRRRAAELGERAMCQVTGEDDRGVPALLSRLRRRYAFWAGLAASVMAVAVLSQFIMTVEVVGNQRVPTAEILAAAYREGVRPGAFGPAIDTWQTGYAVRLHLPEISWLAVNLNGTRAQIVVREALPKPEIVDETEYGDIVARCDGLILDVDATGGQAVHRAGETVMAGEVLIRGDIELAVPLYSGQEPEHMPSRAAGRVEARTWRTLSAQIPLEASVKHYTGEEEERFFLIFLGKRLDFFGKSGISYERYDKITQTRSLSPSEGGLPPLTLGREKVREYTLDQCPVRAEAAEDLLCRRLDAALLDAVGEGQVISRDYSAETADGVLTVTLQAECREEIGRFVPWS